MYMYMSGYRCIWPRARQGKVILIMILDSRNVLEIRQRFWDIVWYKVCDDLIGG